MLYLKCIILNIFTDLVTDLKGHVVTQVAMGKAHTCVLTKKGEVWTFGVNNKGQCGRETGAMSQGGKGNSLKLFYVLILFLYVNFLILLFFFLSSFICFI